MDRCRRNRQSKEGVMEHQCELVIGCKHLCEGTAPDVLLAGDNGHVTHAMCKDCADWYDEEGYKLNTERTTKPSNSTIRKTGSTFATPSCSSIRYACTCSTILTCVARRPGQWSTIC